LPALITLHHFKNPCLPPSPVEDTAEGIDIAPAEPTSLITEGKAKLKPKGKVKKKLIATNRKVQNKKNGRTIGFPRGKGRPRR
jgi:hypothetical protein